MLTDHGLDAVYCNLFDNMDARQGRLIGVYAI